MQEERGLQSIREAINYAVEAGRLRAAIKEYGSGLRALERLADRYSASTAERLAGAWAKDAGLREWAGPARRAGGENPERLDW